MRSCDTCGGTIKFVNGSIAKCEYCGRLFQVNEDNLSEANMESLYSEALGLFGQESEEDVLKSIEIFDALGSYKDSSNKVYYGKNKISKARADEADRKLEEQRRNELAEIERKKRESEEKQKKKIVTIIGTVAVAMIVVVIVAVSVSNSKKNDKYQKAVAYLDQGEYENAAELFESLGDYKDAADCLRMVQENIAAREDTYKKGVDYYNEGLFSEAINSFSEIAGYIDSNEYIENASRKLYEQGEAFFSEEEYDKAKMALGNIPETSGSYTKAVALIKQVDEKLVDIQNMKNYENAVSAYESGEYEKAQKIFLEISDYKDSNDYLTNIGEVLFQLAKNEFESQNYDEGARIIHLIDVSDAWSGYAEAKQYLDSTVEEYKNESIARAKETYKSQGESEMNDYLSSRICVLFAQSDASTIKNDILAMYTPTRLTDCVVLDEEYLDGNMKINPQDIFTNEYEYGIEYYDTDYFLYADMSVHEAYTTYYLDSQYVNFTATIVPYDSGGKPAQFSIYVDGNRKYSCTVTDTSRPQAIDIDISGAEEIKIGFYEGYQGHFLLANPYLYENY